METIVQAARDSSLETVGKDGVVERALRGSEDERYWAIIALARAGVADEEVAEVLVQAMKHPSFRVRSAGAWAAGYLEVEGDSVLESLGRLLYDHSEVPRSAAATALNAYGEQGKALLNEAVAMGTMGEKLNALSGLRATPEGLRDERYRQAQRALFPEVLAQLYPDPDVTVNQLENNDFEQEVDSKGHIPGWELVLEDGAEGYMMVDPVRSRNGKQSLLLVRENAKGKLSLRSTSPVTVKANNTAVLRGYFKADDAPLNNVLLFRFERENGQIALGGGHRGHAFHSQTLLRNSQEGHWDKRLVDYTAGDKDEAVYIRIYFNGNPGSLWLDDLSFPSSPYRYTYTGPVRPFTPATSRNLLLDQATAVDGTTAVLKKKKGGAVLVKDEEPIAPVLYYSHRSDFSDNEGMSNHAGIALVTSVVAITDWADVRYPVNFPVWKQADRYDFTTPMEHLRLTAEAAPEAGIILNFAILWPSDWVELNPEHAWLDESGKRGHGTAVHFRGFADVLPEGRRWWPSPYSEKALADAAEVIRAFLLQVKDSPYAGRIVGCFISGGHDGQFYTANWPDYSPVGKQAFRDWLRAKYGTDAGLRQAWNQPQISLATVDIPDLSVRPDDPETLSFLDPRKHQNVVDYRRFSSERGMVIREYFARVFKEEMGTDTVAMTWQMAGGRGDGAHSVFLQSDALDVLIPQPSYELRVPGHYGGVTAPLTSFRHHGKLVVKELDLRTWLRSGGTELSTQRVGSAMTPEMWRNVNRKEIGQMIAAGQGYWYYDIGGNHFRDLDILDEIKATREIADVLVEENAADFKPDVAVVISESSQYWGYPMRRSRSGWLTLQNYALVSLKTSGVPYDEFFLEDILTNEELTDYKVFVFMDAWRLSDAERRYIDDKLKGGGRTLVWMYAPGFISDDGPSTQAIADLVGMQVETSPVFARTDAYWSDSVDSLSRGMDGLQGMGESYRSMFTMAGGPHRDYDVQRFCISDPEVTVLASYRDGAAAIAVRRFSDWTSVYVAAPAALEAQLLNNIAREAGAYVLTDPGQATEMNKGFISIHGMRNASQSFQLPSESTVYSLDTGELIAKETDRFTLPIEAQQQYWLRITTNNNTQR